MKTATITWITHNNYGTMLQAYGLQQCLRQMGVSNDIISDRKIIHEPAPIAAQELSAVQAPVVADNKGMVRRIKKYALNPGEFMHALRGYCIDKQYTRDVQMFAEYQRPFDVFKNERLDIICGLRREDMASLNENYDAFVCGSDQIWSVLEQNFDGYFYLDFARKKKIAYAPSIGTDQIDQDHRQQITAWLRDYCAISVREKQSAAQLSEFTQQDVAWVADPTLLHDSAFWAEFSANAYVPSSKYLLCYFLADKPWYYEYAHAMAKHLKVKLLLIPSNPKQLHRKERCRQPVGPEEFVSLIRHAQYVLTDSYHGSIFSMLFQRNFTYLKRFADTDPACQNIRIYSLFEKAGLTDRIVENKKFEAADVRPIDYTKVDSILQDFRNHSREFLQNALLNI